MLHTSTGGRVPLSALALDLALSRVSLAALKRQARIPLNNEEIQSVRILRDYYARIIETLSGVPDLTPEMVPIETMRTTLQATLSAAGTPSGDYQTGDIAPLETTVRILDALSQDNPLDTENVEELLATFRKLEPKDTPAY